MMSSYKIEWKKSAYKELRVIPKKIIPRIIDAVNSLAFDPFSSHVKKLSGSSRTYRKRVGDYRIIFEIKEQKLTILIIRISHRKNAYR